MNSQVNITKFFTEFYSFSIKAFSVNLLRFFDGELVTTAVVMLDQSFAHIHTKNLKYIGEFHLVHLEFFHVLHVSLHLMGICMYISMYSLVYRAFSLS